MRLVTKIAAALAALSLAAPALACSDHADKTAEAKARQSQTVAKADKQKKAAHAKRAAEKKPAAAATASN